MPLDLHGLVAAAVLDRVGEHLLEHPERHDVELGRHRLRGAVDRRLDRVAAGAHALDQVVEVGLPGSRSLRAYRTSKRGPGGRRPARPGPTWRCWSWCAGARPCRRPRGTARTPPGPGSPPASARRRRARRVPGEPARRAARRSPRPGRAPPPPPPGRRGEAWERAENRSASPSSQGAISSAVPSIPAGSRQLFVPSYARRARTWTPALSSASYSTNGSRSATANAAPTGIEMPLSQTTALLPQRAQPNATSASATSTTIGPVPVTTWTPPVSQATARAAPGA